MERPKKRNAIIDVKTIIPRNGNGGVHVSEEEIELAFKFFQRFSAEENSPKVKINVTDVKKGFATLCKPLQKKDVDGLFLDKKSFTLDDLKTLLKDNPITKDPIDEAFSILTGGTNSFLSEDRLRKILTNLEFGDLTDEELILLIELADSDRDGKIGSEDFRLLSRPKQSKAKTSSTSA
ncbi:hypothetical protein CTEN210_01138 [Chaetoceros tenuissimus]|uniref:EF-hand domain-containing protein n=1 Tax=Chaetoceros tenuissimus TaxID=426638 RepID=A0AAD3CFG4_9STRA|nr:hypothetical protein CTEN210_01138 [Chaetoceros tenuissimus]